MLDHPPRKAVAFNLARLPTDSTCEHAIHKTAYQIIPAVTCWSILCKRKNGVPSPYHYLEDVMVKLEALNSILLLLGVPDNSASQLYLSSCDAQLSTVVPISLTRHMHRIQITNQDLKVSVS